MTQAFQMNHVDRATIKLTAPIAELKIVDPAKYSTLTYDPAQETLLSFAKKCANNVGPQNKKIIEDMKSKGKLLPILLKYWASTALLT